MNQWTNYKFESSSSTIPEFASFARAFKNWLKAEAGNDFEIVSFNRGHFYISGFLKNTKNNKLVYFSIPDVRFNNDWSNQILVRTAKHDKDYSGGANNFVRLYSLIGGAHVLSSL